MDILTFLLLGKINAKLTTKFITEKYYWLVLRADGAPYCKRSSLRARSRRRLESK